MFRAIMVCVDYADLLALTLPYNHHHFDSVWIVTTPRDVETLKVGMLLNEHLQQPKVRFHFTESFYADGADFNKWRALEEGLDVMGREGWLCIMDADVLWPKSVKVEVYGEGLWIGQLLNPGKLYTPMRRMVVPAPTCVPDEATWNRYPLHPQQREFAGYSQIFHASDPDLGEAPWHETDWKHAGGADSFFQEKWSPKDKVRPPFEVLHLGPAGVNWCGRVTDMLDGSKPTKVDEKRAKLRGYLRSRGRVVGDRFRDEKLS